MEADLERAVKKVSKAEAEASRLQKVLDDAASQTKQVRQAEIISVHRRDQRSGAVLMMISKVMW